MKRKITIQLNEKDMNAIEESFFCKVSDKERKTIHKRLVGIWKQLCEGMK